MMIHSRMETALVLLLCLLSFATSKVAVEDLREYLAFHGRAENLFPGPPLGSAMPMFMFYASEVTETAIQELISKKNLSKSLVYKNITKRRDPINSVRFELVFEKQRLNKVVPELLESQGSRHLETLLNEQLLDWLQRHVAFRIENAQTTYNLFIGEIVGQIVSKKKPSISSRDTEQMKERKDLARRLRRAVNRTLGKVNLLPAVKNISVFRIGSSATGSKNVLVARTMVFFEKYSSTVLSNPAKTVDDFLRMVESQLNSSFSQDSEFSYIAVHIKEIPPVLTGETYEMKFSTFLPSHRHPLKWQPGQNEKAIKDNNKILKRVVDKSVRNALENGEIAGTWTEINEVRINYFYFWVWATFSVKFDVKKLLKRNKIYQHPTRHVLILDAINKRLANESKGYRLNRLDIAPPL